MYIFPDSMNYYTLFNFSKKRAESEGKCLEAIAATNFHEVLSADNHIKMSNFPTFQELPLSSSSGCHRLLDAPPNSRP